MCLTSWIDKLYVWYSVKIKKKIKEKMLTNVMFNDEKIKTCLIFYFKKWQCLIYKRLYRERKRCV